jgi:hypothetical protein
MLHDRQPLELLLVKGGVLREVASVSAIRSRVIIGWLL